MTKRAIWIVISFVIATPFVGCGPALIDDSALIAEDAEIPDTIEYRAIVELVDEYRRALEDKDVGMLRRIVSSDYYENGGTSYTTSDDYGYDGLTEAFELIAEHVRQLRLWIEIHAIEIEGTRANVYVEYSYNMLYVVDGQEHWKIDRDLNRIELVLENDQWRIAAGL